VIAAVLLFAFQTQEPVLGDCARDPDTLAARAAETLAESPEPSEAAIAQRSGIRVQGVE